jgi:hypothetical protein
MLTSIARPDEKDEDHALAALMGEDAARIDEYIDHVLQVGASRYLDLVGTGSESPGGGLNPDPPTWLGG